MVPKVNDRGSSFKGVMAYLAHDLDQKELPLSEQSAERVSWFEIGNMLASDPEKAAKVMAWTAKHSEEIKREAGVSTAGRKASENVVYHFSLSWALDETPSPEHQREMARDTLAHLGLSEHEHVIVGHGDTKHFHAHVVVNLVHPGTGRMADLPFDKRRLQSWALDYEKEHGIKCEQRLVNAQEYERTGRPSKYRDNQRWRDQVTRAWHACESGAEFVETLKAEGLRLARGKQKNPKLMLVDETGDVQALTRQLDIEETNRKKSKAIAGKLADLDRDGLPDADALSQELRAQSRAQEQAKEQAAIQQEEPSRDEDRQPHIWDREAAEAQRQTAELEAADSAAEERAKAEIEQERRAELERQRDEAEQQRFAAWYANRTRREEREARPLLELGRRQQREAEALEEKLKAFYAKDLEAVKTRAREMQRIIEARGVLPSIRRFWRGEKDRTELSALRRTIADTRGRIDGARAKLAAEHARQRQQLLDERLAARFTLEGREPSWEQRNARLMETSTPPPANDRGAEPDQRIEEARKRAAEAFERESKREQEGRGKDKGFEFEL